MMDASLTESVGVGESVELKKLLRAVSTESLRSLCEHFQVPVETPKSKCTKTVLATKLLEHQPLNVLMEVISKQKKELAAVTGTSTGSDDHEEEVIDPEVLKTLEHWSKVLDREEIKKLCKEEGVPSSTGTKLAVLKRLYTKSPLKIAQFQEKRPTSPAVLPMETTAPPALRLPPPKIYLKKISNEIMECMTKEKTEDHDNESSFSFDLPLPLDYEKDAWDPCSGFIFSHKTFAVIGRYHPSLSKVKCLSIQDMNLCKELKYAYEIPSHIEVDDAQFVEDRREKIIAYLKGQVPLETEADEEEDEEEEGHA